jgi:hypothetical protein
MRLTTIIKNVSTICFVSLLLFSAQAALALPAAFQANYSVAKGSMTLGNLHASLKYSGNNYQYHKYTKATGVAALLTGIKITENTDGQFSGQNITPRNYLFNQSRRSKARIDKAQFTSNRAVGSYKNKAYNVAISPGTQDRASLELVLARDLAQNKTRLIYSVFERGKLKHYSFQKLGYEKIQTPAGTFNALKVQVVRKGNKRETTFWMAKELDYLPVKIRHKEKDDVITTIIKNYKKL